jgi:hypothetical protein
MVLAFTMIGTSASRGQDAIHRFHPLVETSARRLLIAEKVALAKWDSGAAVDDLPREPEVTRDAPAAGLSRYSRRNPSLCAPRSGRSDLFNVVESNTRSFARALPKRDITVPTGQSRRFAIS